MSQGPAHVTSIVFHSGAGRAGFAVGLLYAGLHASASLQYSRHLATSFTASEPVGIGYSSSMSAKIGHCSFLSSWRTSLIGV